MHGIFFEDFHSATKDFPYFDSEMRNINYLSHFHEEIEIIYVLDGEVNITAESGLFTARQGDIAIFMPFEIHSFSSMVENHLYVMKLNCSNSVERTDFSKLRFKSNLASSSTSLCKAVSSLMDTVCKEIREKKPGYAYACNSLSNMIICEIMRSENLTKADASLSKKHLNALTLLENVNNYIEEHYKEPVSLRDAAKFCNFSEYYFAHFFKETTGLTFFDFLTSYRLEKAVGLLRYSNKNITETAFECGFSNTRAFNRAFKTKFNITPSEYIKADKH